MSKRASTLRLYMKERRKRLVVPEAVQAEAARHLASGMRSDTAAARKAHKRLVRTFGTLSRMADTVRRGNSEARRTPSQGRGCSRRLHRAATGYCVTRS